VIFASSAHLSHMSASAAIQEPVPRRGRAERLRLRLRALLWGRGRGGDRVVLTFALAGLAAVVVIAIAGALVLRDRGLSEAIDQAKVVTRVTGEGIVAPSVTRGVLRGDPRALGHLDAVVRRDVVHNPVVRVKLWTAGGRIVYSDEHALIGRRFPLGADERKILARGGVAAEESDLARPENRYERGGGDLLEVYLPVRTPDGRRLLFESYQRFSSIATGGERVWLAFAPVLIGGLLLLELFQLPLARSLVKRLRAGQAESERLLRAALEVSDAERRRLAANLHDGAVQELVGVSYTLSAAARDADPEHRARLQDAAARTRATIRDLRTLLVDLYPPNLERAGLPAALRDLAVNLEHHGIQATLDAPDAMSLPKPSQALLYRIAQEALRNVVEHAEASRVLVRVETNGTVARLTVSDDGVGFDSEAVRAAPPQGHFGLRMLSDLAEEAGGSVTMQSQPGAGTTIAAEVPIA
jgi:two-component system NarL family sensor kinase